MHLTVFKRAAIALVLALTLAPAVHAQDAVKVLSSEIGLSRERAELKLELDNGRKLTMATTYGPAGAAGASAFQSDVAANGDQILTLRVERGSAIDRAWRDLLNRAMDAQSDELPSILRDWRAPAGGLEFDNSLEAAFSGLPANAHPAAPAAPVAPGMDDSVSRLAGRVEQLQEQLEEARRDAIEASRRHRGPDWLAPLRHVGRGITGIFATLVTYAVLFGLAFIVIMFGGRKYIEGVADTVRAGVGRSFLVGLAGSFLLLPVFVLGVIALAISIVGIPALLVWIPLFPVGAVAAALLGFIGVAHHAGETWAERRYEGGEWMSRANSYYFIATGLALLSSLFIAGHVITMAGPWLGGINNVLNFFGVLLTWSAATVGFGAVLISRGGKRPNGRVDADVGFTESANV